MDLPVFACKLSQKYDSTETSIAVDHFTGMENIATEHSCG